MGRVRVHTLTGEDVSLPEGTVQTWRAGLRGPLLRAGEDGYGEARRVWNGMIDRRPALIVRCVGVADVTHAVRFARAHNLLVAVRGGGHAAGVALASSPPSSTACTLWARSSWEG